MRSNYMVFFDRLLEVLHQDSRFFTAKGELLRNSVYEAAMKMDANLLKLLYKNDITRKRFLLMLKESPYSIRWVLDGLSITENFSLTPTHDIRIKSD